MEKMFFDNGYCGRNYSEESQDEETESTDEEYANEMFCSSERITEYEESEENHFGEHEYDGVFESQWETKMRYYEPPVQQYYQKMLLVPLSDPYTKFYNNPRGNWITRDERRLKEVEIDYIIDDRIRYKRHEFIQNSSEVDLEPMNENIFISTTDTNEIPQFVKTKIHITHEFKSFNRNSSTPISFSSRDSFVNDDTSEINENVYLPNNRSMRKAKKRGNNHNDKKRRRQEKLIRRKLREYKREKNRIEIRRIQNYLPINIRDYPLLADFSEDDDDDEFNDRLVIDEDKF